jgi:hypothetical protein
MREALGSGQARRLAPSGDPAALAQAIAALWRDLGQALAKGERGARFAAGGK